MFEFKRAKKHLETKYGPDFPGEDHLPLLFAEVGGLGVELASEDFSSDDDNDQRAFMKCNAVGRMLQLHQGELRSWTWWETWRLVREFKHDSDQRQFRAVGEDGRPVALFPAPRILQSEVPGLLVTCTPGGRGPNGEVALRPDFDHPASTIAVPACGGTPGVTFVRDTWGVTLATIFAFYAEVATSAKIYSAWMEADVICARRKMRGKAGGQIPRQLSAKGKEAGGGKGKSKGKAACGAASSKKGKDKGPGKGKEKSPGKGKEKSLGKGRERTEEEAEEEEGQGSRRRSRRSESSDSDKPPLRRRRLAVPLPPRRDEQPVAQIRVSRWPRGAPQPDLRGQR